MVSLLNHPQFPSLKDFNVLVNSIVKDYKNRSLNDLSGLKSSQINYKNNIKVYSANYKKYKNESSAMSSIIDLAVEHKITIPSDLNILKGNIDLNITSSDRNIKANIVSLLGVNKSLRLLNLETNKKLNLVKDFNKLKSFINKGILEKFEIVSNGLKLTFSPIIIHLKRVKRCLGDDKITCNYCTNEIKEKKYYVGRVEVIFEKPSSCFNRFLSCNGINFRSLSYATNYFHPHIRAVNNCKEICMKSYKSLFTSLMSKGRISDATMLVYQFLTSYNPHSPLIPMEYLQDHVIFTEGAKRNPGGIIDGSYTN